jgi:hypothetical protein
MSMSRTQQPKEAAPIREPKESRSQIEGEGKREAIQ